jgi:hypothetical protein
VKTFILKEELLSTADVLMWVRLTSLTWLCFEINGTVSIEHVDNFYGRDWEPASRSFDVFEDAR